MRKPRPTLWGALCVSLLSFNLYAADAEPHAKVKICNPEETRCAGIDLINGKDRLLTSSIVTIEQLFGRDPQATTWFYIGTQTDASGIGSAGDTIRVQIPAAVTPLNAIYPAVDVTTTVSAPCVADSNPERCVAQDVCSDLNADSDFINARWKCEVIKDFSGVFISSRLFNEFGERTTWTVSSTGTTVVTQAFDDIVARGFATELARSPNDPRKGILAISGTVTAIPGSIGDRFFEFALNGGSSDMTVNGSGTPVVFTVAAHPTLRTLIEQIRCFGGGNGIQFGNFLSQNSALTNGVLIEIRSEGTNFTFEPIKTTQDWKNLFSTIPGTDFRLDIQSGQDEFIAQFRPTQPFPIEPQGTVVGGDDFITITVQDALQSGIAALECAAVGFQEEI